MESSQECLRRAARDRAEAEASPLPTQKARFEESARRWEDMARRAVQIEQEAARREEEIKERAEQRKLDAEHRASLTQARLERRHRPSTEQVIRSPRPLNRLTDRAIQIWREHIEQYEPDRRPLGRARLRTT